LGGVGRDLVFVLDEALDDQGDELFADGIRARLHRHIEVFLAAFSLYETPCELDTQSEARIDRRVESKRDALVQLTCPPIFGDRSACIPLGTDFLAVGTDVHLGVSETIVPIIATPGGYELEDRNDERTRSRTPLHVQPRRVDASRSNDLDISG
jgi:hypothetical protein